VNARQEGLPVRHEFYDAEEPSYPILLPTGAEIVITEHTVERRYVGLPTEEIVFRYYLDLS
jgi:hypothetical protein